MTLPASAARIGMIDDHEQIVRGIRATLDDHADLHLAAGAGTVTELLAITTELDLVLLDLRLEDDSSPADNIAALAAQDIPVLVYTSADEMYLVREAALAGVLGVVRKNTREADLLGAIRQALLGDAVPSIDWAAAIDSDEDFVDLSPQQRRVLQLYAAGESQSRVAREIGISADTVTDYVNRIRLRYKAVGRPAPTKSELLRILISAVRRDKSHHARFG